MHGTQSDWSRDNRSDSADECGTPDIVTHEGKEIEMTDKDCGEPDSADAGKTPEHGVSQSDHQKRGVEVDRAILLQRVCVSDVGFNLEPAARFIESHCERNAGPTLLSGSPQ